MTTDTERLVSAIDQLSEALRRDPGEPPDPRPSDYIEWLVRMRAPIAMHPTTEDAATARLRIHNLLICGEHTPLERAIARYRKDVALGPIIRTLEELTGDTMYACPCCQCLTMAEEPPGTWCLCPVCGWEDDGVTTGGGPNPPLEIARREYQERTAPPSWLRDPRPEELPHGG